LTRICLRKRCLGLVQLTAALSEGLP
jgi:hypothetical protein